MGYEMALVLLIAQPRDKTDIEKHVLCENVVRRKTSVVQRNVLLGRRYLVRS